MYTRGFQLDVKVENILKGSLDSIPFYHLHLQRKVKLWVGKCKHKTLLGVVNELLKRKSLMTSPSNVLPYYLK